MLGGASNFRAKLYYKHQRVLPRMKATAYLRMLSKHPQTNVVVYGLVRGITSLPQKCIPESKSMRIVGEDSLRDDAISQ